MPKVSVIMSVYHEPVEWMILAIDSILNQTFRDFEFIIINDKPNRIENAFVLNEYVKKDCRIKLIANDYNIGLTKSLNKGLAIAHGKYIARMDADDISLPERLAKQVSYLDKHSEVIAVGTWAREINNKGEIGRSRRPSRKVKVLRSRLLFDTPGIHPTVMFRRENNGRRLLYDESFRYAQDYELWADLLRDNVMTNIEEELLLYRISYTQISNSHRTEQDECARRVFNNIIDWFGFVADEQVANAVFVITKQRTTHISLECMMNSIQKFRLENRHSEICNKYLYSCILISAMDYARYHYSKQEQILLARSLIGYLSYVDLKSILIALKIVLKN